MNLKSAVHRVSFPPLFSLLCATALPLQAAAPALIDPCIYPNAASAQAVWLPMGHTAPVSPATLKGTSALRFPCNFDGPKMDRASWDRKGTLDLSSCRGIEFDILCKDASPISYFSIYFQSGNGWYYAPFFPETLDWETIRIDKSKTSIEGNPSGWGKITAIRFSAWCGKTVNTEVFLRNVRKTGLLGADCKIAILRADSTAQSSPGESKAVQQYAAAMAETFEALSIPCATVSDLDLTPAVLKELKLVVLPHNPTCPARVVDLLSNFVQAGGKLMALYIVPEKLQPLLQIKSAAHIRAPYPGAFSTMRFASNALPGVPTLVGQQSWNINSFRPVSDASGSRVLAEWLDGTGKPTGYPAVLASSNGLVMTHVLLSDDPVNKRRMLMAMTGHLVPEIWQQAAERALADVGTIGKFKSFAEAAKGIATLAPNAPKVRTSLNQAESLYNSGVELSTRKAYPDAIEKASAAARELEQAFCAAQKPLPGEFRAFWCHSAFGVAGMQWDEAIRRLADNGFTAILPNMLWGGAAFYESKVLPVASQVKERGDQVAQCLAACRKYGLAVHVWKVNWNLGHAAPAEFIQRMRSEGRLQANSRGKEEPWLCPSHPKNQKLEIDSMLELVRNYDIDGIHFDYIRYPDSDHCFCNGCRERFAATARVRITNWPAQVLAEGKLREAWLDWRRDNITKVVRGVSQDARALKPKIKISAAVFRNWPTDRDFVGQDWKLWCDNGYVDFVCPMDYTASNRSFENMVTQQLQWKGPARCYPGIGVSASSSHFGPDRVIEQIQITRQYNTKGFIIFNYGVAESKVLVPLLGLGITRKTSRE